MAKDKQGAPAADIQQPVTPPSAPLQMNCTVLVNGALIQGYHHAIGKVMNLPKDVADYHAAQNPPDIVINGTA